MNKLWNLDFSHVSCCAFQLDLLIAGCQHCMIPSVRISTCALLTQLSWKLALSNACAFTQDTFIWLDHNWERMGHVRHFNTKGSKVQCVIIHWDCFASQTNWPETQSKHPHCASCCWSSKWLLKGGWRRTCNVRYIMCVRNRKFFILGVVVGEAYFGSSRWIR